MCPAIHGADIEDDLTSHRDLGILHADSVSEWLLTPPSLVRVVNVTREISIRFLTSWIWVTARPRPHVPKPCGAAVAAHTAGQQRVICNCRDASMVLFGRGASAPDGSRAATGSAMS